ncbi:MAG: serine--tRNA ligase [Elusimicrobia bacterium]|nr:serine--tRNA ligase [Elusimicrobiota bacterium]
MLDLKFIRKNPEKSKNAIKNRGKKALEVFNDLMDKDRFYRELLTDIEALRSQRNEISKKIKDLKIAKKDKEAQNILDEANRIKEIIKSKEDKLSEIEKDMRTLSLIVPNMPHESVPSGNSEKDNKLVSESMEDKRDFSFKPLDHHTLGEALDILDFETASKLSGSRFALLKGMGAKLERAIIKLMLDIHTVQNDYLEILPPFLIKSDSLIGTGQLPKFEEDLYKIAGDNSLYLVPTAEVPLSNIHRDSIIDEAKLPIKYTAFTSCFRQEAGSYGKDTRGLIRNHQFNKVELVWLTKPEDSMDALMKLKNDAEEVLRALKIPYRVIELCSGDLGFSSSKTYDLEVWMPGENKFREISSCSNCMDFQARRMNARFRRKDKKIEYLHTLNGSGLAVGRTFAAILENYQNEDGSITVPEALRDYMEVDTIEL